MKTKLSSKKLSTLKRNVMDSLGNIDVDLLGKNKAIQNMFQEIHYDLMDVSIVEENF